MLLLMMMMMKTMMMQKIFLLYVYSTILDRTLAELQSLPLFRYSRCSSSCASPLQELRAPKNPTSGDESIYVRRAALEVPIMGFRV